MVMCREKDLMWSSVMSRIDYNIWIYPPLQSISFNGIKAQAKMHMTTIDFQNILIIERMKLTLQFQ
jgi:hypothetical protein